MSEAILMPAGLVAAFSMGLLGSPHCVGMCGGIATALAPPIDGSGPARRRAWAMPLWLALGRIGTYAGLGLLVGALGDVAGVLVGAAAGPAARILLGLLLVLAGLSLGGWWPSALAWLEKPAAGLWGRLSPWARSLLPVETAGRAVLAGGIWGLLPCGLVYGALAGAAVVGSAANGAAWMAAFGLGTVPAVVGASWLGGGLRAWTSRRAVRGAAGALLVAAGLWTLATPIAMQWRGVPHGDHSAAPHAGHAGHADHPGT